MKTLVYILIGFTFIISSCDTEPYADFYSSNSLVNVGEIVYFTNTSVNAFDFEWDFGDGTYTHHANPSHAYTQNGLYTVRLSAYDEDGEVDFAYTTIEVRSPVAEFSISNSVVDENETIYFTNYSYGADNYYWDFGDGYSSTAVHPEHSYTEYGTYAVSLTAYSGNLEIGQASLEITVLFPTTLKVTVLEYYDEYPVPEASVILFPSYIDWVDFTNEVAEGITDANGETTITHLDPISYYLDVWHENHNNYLLADEDVNFIKTLPLYNNQLNEFIAWVDLIESKSQKEGRQSISKFKVMKMQRVYKDKILQYKTKP